MTAPMTTPRTTTPRTGAPNGRRVPWLRAASLCYRVLIRQIVTPGRIVVQCVLGLAMVLMGLSLGLSYDESWEIDRIEAGASLADGFGLVIIVPVVTLVFSIAVLANAREDRTLVYLWLKPMDRSAVAAAASAAAATVALPLTAVPTVTGGVLAAWGSDRVGDLVWGALAAAALGTAAYSGLFVLLGLLVKRAILWGIAFVLLWEGLAAGLGDFAARLSLRGYTRSVLTRVTDVDLGFSQASTAAAVGALAAVSAVSLALATARLSRLDVD